MKQTLSLIIFFLLCSSLHAASGKFSLFIKGFKTFAISEPRDFYVPTEYTRLKNKTYSVLYMQDGQNLFDPARAFLGQTWKAEIILNQLISQGLMDTIIVVAIDNTKLSTFEYTQDQDESEDQNGGGADGYLNLITRELKPRVDASLRTKKIVIQSGAIQSEKYWAQRFTLALQFLFPPN